MCSIIFVAATGYHHHNTKKLAKVVKKVVKNFVSPGKNPKKVNRLENKKKKIIGIP
jgi:hypothetical protein